MLQTRGKQLYEFTDELVRWVRESGIREGLLTLHVRHTSASLLIQENADPEVQRDLERFFLEVVEKARQDAAGALSTGSGSGDTAAGTKK